MCEFCQGKENLVKYGQVYGALKDINRKFLKNRIISKKSQNFSKSRIFPLKSVQKISIQKSQYYALPHSYSTLSLISQICYTEFTCELNLKFSFSLDILVNENFPLLISFLSYVQNNFISGACTAKKNLI